MATITPLKQELANYFKKPYRLPRNILLAALGTFAGIGFGIIIHTFHRGLPYIAADVFVWTLASSTACQLGMTGQTKKISEKELEFLRITLIRRNIALFLVATPVVVLFISIASLILGDWSKFIQALVIGISAAIINLGFGNIASVLWVYRSKSLWSIRKDRLSLFELGIFVATSYTAATLAIVLSTLPALTLLNLGKDTLSHKIIKVLILWLWSILVWFVCLNLSDTFAKKYNTTIKSRLNGVQLHIKNKRLKKVLKV